MTGSPSRRARGDLTQAGLESAMAGRACGWPVRFFDRVGSTNDAALDWARRGAAHGSLIVADAQCAGRGRRGRRWEGGEGSSILASFIVHPRVPADRLGLIGGGMAVAAARAVLSLTGLPIRTKWPNDLWIHGRKCGGLLLETFHSEGGGRCLVAGIGMNVNQRPEDLPATTRIPATSLALEAGRAWDRQELLVRLALEIADVLETVERHPDRLLAEWAGLETTLGREIEATEKDRTVRGIAEGLLPDGGLRLRVGENDRVLHWGEVTLAPITDRSDNR